MRDVMMAAALGSVLAMGSCGRTAIVFESEKYGECVPGEVEGSCPKCVCTEQELWECEETCSIEVSIERAADILFVIDNSGSMAEEQATLARSFAAFTDVLERQSGGASYRIGITTTDVGNAGCTGVSTPEIGNLRATSCLGRLDEFIFSSQQVGKYYDERQRGCRDLCEHVDIELKPTSTDVDPTRKPRPWLERREGKTNLPSGISMVEAFQCMGPQGINGCGFEAPLEAMRRALRRAQAPGEPNYGFLRDHGILAIVLVTDEVDCSADPDYANLFNPWGDTVFWADPSGASSAICWNAGITCSGGPGTYDECHAEDKGPDGAPTDVDPVVYPLQRYYDELAEIETAKSATNSGRQVMVAVLAGVPPGYPEVPMSYQDAEDDEFQHDFGIGPACESENGKAVPAVRLREFAETLADEDTPNVFSVCSPDYSVALEAIANSVATMIPNACVPTCVADATPNTPGLQPYCTLTEEVPTADGVESNIVRRCTMAPDGWEFPDDETDVCFRTLNDPDGSTTSVWDDLPRLCREQGSNVEFAIQRRNEDPPPTGTVVRVECRLAEDPSGCS